MIQKAFGPYAAAAVLIAILAAPAATAQGDADGWRLSLVECLHLGLENNLGLVSARYGPDLAEVDIDTNQSFFDPVSSTFYDRSEQEAAVTQASTVSGSEQDLVVSSLNQSTKAGIDYSVDFSLVDNLQTGGLTIAPQSYFANLGFNVTIPLLKGLGSEVATVDLVLARNNLEISRRDLEGQAELTIQQLEGAYWDVLAAIEGQRIALLQLARAEDLLELNKKKVEVGTLAPIEITQAEAGVASQEEGVIVAEVTLQDAEDELRRLLAIPSNDPLWDRGIVPIDRPQSIDVAMAIDVEAAIETAFASRPEIINARQSVSDNELSERVAKKDIRHQLDLSGGYTATGADLDNPFGPDGVPGTPDDIFIPADGIGDAISNIFDNDQFNWNARVTYTIPIGNRAAKANYARRRILREQSQVDLQDQEQQIRVDVRRAARSVTSGVKRVEAAKKNTELQRKKLDAEEKKYENGMSTSFEVLTFQNDLADAEVSLIRAALDYAKSLTALERSKGTLLESRGLSISGN